MMEPRHDTSRITCGIRLSAEHRDRLRELAAMHGLAQGGIVEVFLDILDTSQIGSLLRAKRLKSKKEGKERGKSQGRKKSGRMTAQTFASQLGGLTANQLFVVAEMAWRMQGNGGNYEKTRSPRRGRRPGACSKMEVSEQARGLSPEQLQVLVDRIATLRTHPVPVAAPVGSRPMSLSRALIKSLTGLLPVQLRIVAETAWKLKGHAKDFESSRTPQRRKRGFVGHKEVIALFVGLSPEHRRVLADLIATFRDESEASQ